MPSGPCRLRSVRGLLYEDNFLSIVYENGDLDDSADERFQAFESAAGVVLGRIDSSELPVVLGEYEKRVISEIMRRFILRSPLAAQQMLEKVENVLDPRVDPKPGFIFLQEETGREQFEKFFLAKAWAIHRCLALDRCFITSDNPVTILNYRGIGYDDTEIFFPLDPNTLLSISGIDMRLKVEGEKLIDRANNIMASHSSRFLISKTQDEMEKAAHADNVQEFWNSNRDTSFVPR